MRLSSAFVLGFMVSAMSAVTVAVPAVAKEKAAAAPKADYSPAFVKVVQPIQKAVNAKDWAAVQAGLPQVEAAASTPDDKFLLNYFRYQAAAGVNDEAQLKVGLLGMLDSGKAPPELAVQLEGMAGQFAIQEGNPDAAIPHLEKALAAPGANPEFRYLLAEAHFAKGVKAAGGKITPESRPSFEKGLVELQGSVDGLKAAGKPVPARYYSRGTEIARAVGSPSVATWAKAGVMEGGSKDGWYALITSYQDSHRTISRGENLDLFRLMSQARVMRSVNEYAEYTDALLKGGLIGEAKAAIDAGRASGTLQPTQLNDVYQVASGQVAKDKASLPSSETAAAKAPNGKLSASTGDAYLGYGDYAKAVTLYRQALGQGGVDANEINTHLGIALLKSGDEAGARAAFGAVTGAGARKDIADLWLTYLDHKPA